ncbi:MAG: methylated-DNA--[protein]-cysteine S-methyltransferase [Acidiferrobacterales bacterium]
MAARIQNYSAVISAPFGALGICAGEMLVSIDFLSGPALRRRPTTALAREVCTQLRAYFRDPRHVFDLPLTLNGSAYQERVWSALCRIPAGRVVSYGDLARRLDSGARAVGAACRANPVPVVVPCHRIVASRGIGGFMGATAGAALQIKRWLIEHERV